MQHDPIIIIGGGFGGVYTAQELLKRGYAVLLISETNYFTFTPLLHEVATGTLVTHDVIFEYESFFSSRDFRFVRGRADRIDRGRKSVWVNGSEFPYRYLVVATGSRTNFRSMQGTEHTYELKNVEDAILLKKAILSRAQDANHHVAVSVVGGGATGIELIFDISQMLQALRGKDPGISYVLQLIHSKNTFCNLDAKGVQAYIRDSMVHAEIHPICNAYVEVVHPDRIETTAGTFESDVTIITSGVRPNTEVFAEDLVLDERGHVPVRASLQTIEDEHIFALGDVASINGIPIPKLAQTATREALVVVENIHRLEVGEAMTGYDPVVLGMLFSLGYGNGIGIIYGYTVKGVLAWYLWRTVYLFKTPGVANKLRVAFSWTLGLFKGRNLTEL